jgi:hypothetical protein
MKGLIDLFKVLLDLIKIQSNTNPETPSSEGVDDAYKWFLETLEDRDNKRVVITNDKILKPGKIYVFKYDPKYKTVLDYYDMNPIVIALGQTMGAQGKLEVGINISWYPPNARKYIISKIREFYKPMIESNIKKSPYDAEGQGFIPIDLYNLKTALDQVGLSFAIRTYIPELIKEPKAVVCYEDWEIISRMDKPKVIPQFEGKISLFDVYKAYENHVRNYRQNAGKYKQKRDTAKKLNRYKFIK